MKQLIFENTSNLVNALNSIRAYEIKLKAITSELSRLLPDVVISYDLMVDLILDGADNTVRQLFMDKIPDTDPHTGLNTDKEVTMRNLTLPNIGTLRDLCHSAKAGFEAFLPLFDINGKVITLNQERYEEYNDRFRVYATSQEQYDLFKRLQNLASVMNALNSEINFVSCRESIIKYDLGEMFAGKGGKLVVKPEAYRAFASKLK